MNNEFFQRMHERDRAEMPVNEALKTKIASKLGLGRSPSWFNRVGAWLRSQAKPVGGFALASTLVFALAIGLKQTSSSLPGFGPTTDDWQYNGTFTDAEQGANTVASIQQSVGLSSAGKPAGLGSVFQRAAPAPQMAASAPSSISTHSYEAAADAMLGFSVGGAKDIVNFRENIKNGFLPIESDLTYEGLFYDYSFDTGQREPCVELFCPSYARALVRNPVTGQEETYLSVGLNSNIKESDFKRQKTSFVVVLDISGSMGSPFDQYYYDRTTGKQVEVPRAEAKKTKMELANEALSALVDQLNPDDRLGIVLFSDAATVAKPLRLVGETDRSALKRHIMQLKPTNGTNMSAGLEAGSRLLRCNDALEASAQCVADGYAKRIIFITDAMPNQGEFGAKGLHGLIEQYANERIETTLLGVGVDFQTELVEALTKVRGANYLSIHSAKDFKQRLGEDFDFLVTPLVYDLRLDVSGSDYQIEQVYGSLDADLATGQMMHVRTLFPSKTENGETKGGLVLLKLRKTGEAGALTLRTSYEEKMGKKSNSEATVSFAGLNAASFDNTGIRKGVLLTQYGTLLKDWIRSERGTNDPFFSPGTTNWDRSSLPLKISAQFKEKLQGFMGYFEREANAIGDSSLLQEKEILDRLTRLMGSGSDSDQGSLPFPLIDDWRN